MEVHRIQDLLQIPGDHEFVGAPRLIVNVGFALTTMFHGPQPDETPEEWQTAISYILKTWTTASRILIRSGNPLLLKVAISPDFVETLRSTKEWDTICDNDVEFVKM